MTKIIYKKGDALKGPEKYLLHGCNAQGVMASGIAKSIKDTYPDAYTEYRKTHLGNGLVLGDIIPVLCGDKIIINAITQQYYGRDPIRYVSYNAVASCISAVNQIATEEVAMPYIGAGLGNGDWETISLIIEELSTNFQPVVYEYK